MPQEFSKRLQYVEGKCVKWDLAGPATVPFVGEKLSLNQDVWIVMGIVVIKKRVAGTQVVVGHRVDIRRAAQA